MSTKTKLRSSNEIIDHSLRSHCQWQMSRYLQFIALDAAIIESRRTLDFSLQSAFHPFDAEPGAVANDLAERASYEAGKRLAGLLAVKDVLDHCPELPAIRKQLDPLFQELDEAREREAEEARLASLAAQEKRIALQAAREKAIAQVEASFA